MITYTSVKTRLYIYNKNIILYTASNIIYVYEKYEHFTI